MKTIPLDVLRRGNGSVVVLAPGDPQRIDLDILIFNRLVGLVGIDLVI